MIRWSRTQAIAKLYRAVSRELHTDLSQVSGVCCAFHLRGARNVFKIGGGLCLFSPFVVISYMQSAVQVSVFANL